MNAYELSESDFDDTSSISRQSHIFMQDKVFSANEDMIYNDTDCHVQTYNILPQD